MKTAIKLLALLFSVSLATGCGGTPAGSSGEPEKESSSQQQVESSSQAAAQSSSQARSSSQTTSRTSIQASSSPRSSSQARSSSQVRSSSSQASQDYDKVSGNFKFSSAQLNTPQEIHTADQKKYLNFSGDYYHITASDLTSFNANGNTNASTPNKVKVNWEYTAPEGKTLSAVNFKFGQKADLSDGYEISVGTVARTLSFNNPYLGDNYFQITAKFSDNTTDASNIEVFKVDTQAPRNISAGNMPNVRDMGGRTTYAGGKIKQGLIYRGAGNRFDNRSSVDSDCQKVLTQQLKIKTEINVANGTSNNLNFSGVTVKDCFMDYGNPTSVSGYSGQVGVPYSNLSRNAEKIRQVMDILADENNYPVFYHCRIGTDRTGITGMMINGLLGVKFNEIFQDYCFSNFAPIDGQRYPNKSSDKNGDDAAKYIEEIKKMPGATYQEQTYNALLSIGCKAETLNKIINFMTEGAKATFSGTEKIASGDSLTSDGTRGTSSDYKNPAVYYTLTSNKKASFTATTTAGEKDVVVYLGSTDSSNTTKLADRIALKIDGTQQTIVDKTLFTAGFGTTAQTSRTAYMFQILGKYNLSAGSHTFEISVKSGTFYMGTIGVFDHVEPTA